MGTNEKIIIEEKIKTQENESLLKKVDRGVKEAIAETIEQHRKEGFPIVIYENGKVVWKKLEQNIKK